MQKQLTFFSAKKLAFMPYLMISFNDKLTNNIVSFEQLGPAQESILCIFLPPSQKTDIFGNICNILIIKLEYKE